MKTQVAELEQETENVKKRKFRNQKGKDT